MDKERLLKLTESAVAWLSRIPPKRVVEILSVTGLLIGLLFILKPGLAIAIQKKFYEKINWRIEPISMQKEISHTRMMGLFMVIFLLATLYLVLFTDLFCP